jgi:hypothetical protein
LSDLLSQASVRYAVVNYGHTQFYSSQEAALFTSLLRQGHKCDIAIFLDGINDSLTAPSDIPGMTDGTAAGFLQAQDQAAENARYVTVSPLFPPLRVLDAVLRRLVGKALYERTSGPNFSEAKYDPVSIYRFNLSMIEKISEAENIHVLFYWQPTPFDYMSGAASRRTSSEFPRAQAIPEVNRAVLQTIKEGDFHFIADMFKDDAYTDIYVDLGHYGDKGNTLIAQRIADQLKKDGLL